MAGKRMQSPRPRIAPVLPAFLRATRATVSSGRLSPGESSTIRCDKARRRVMMLRSSTEPESSPEWTGASPGNRGGPSAVKATSAPPKDRRIGPPSSTARVRSMPRRGRPPPPRPSTAARRNSTGPRVRPDGQLMRDTAAFLPAGGPALTPTHKPHLRMPGRFSPCSRAQSSAMS